MTNRVSKVRQDIPLYAYRTKKLFFSNFYCPSLVHPCDEENNGGCSQICNKKEEKHECACEAGFVLGENQRVCNKG